MINCVKRLQCDFSAGFQWRKNNKSCHFPCNRQTWFRTRVLITIMWKGGLCCILSNPIIEKSISIHPHLLYTTSVHTRASASTFANVHMSNNVHLTCVWRGRGRWWRDAQTVVGLVAENPSKNSDGQGRAERAGNAWYSSHMLKRVPGGTAAVCCLRSGRFKAKTG